uniref:Threonylcarbamoyladenosine tRNA methylthiotransferase MtaB n=1 Tax=Candidatus Kentrum eta TaxID=2126337 RepID=A0A450VCJ8_9GAMM|nr:MAG: threonylcarbamoyladenosine tRNA methylthiotransferase MtaB [Candidatus Kentron sp. H]VFJ96654.1 MAG: threonylcarbamoyladenosine tRNA methylthiotransferase MtaB [Candidatus Kentron sp. H]VFK02488.1 MAG: threonylcarbamoyladenosine tRNA methylthiotransferase MtaB [Candidatus Kentron sp. H]
MSRVAFYTFGCRINQYDTETIRTLLEETGRFHTVPARETADIYIINTCSVTAQADATARKAIRRISSERPAARIVVTGCYAQRSGAEIARLPGVALVLGVPDRVRIVSEIDRILAATETGVRETTAADRQSHWLPSCPESTSSKEDTSTPAGRNSKAPEKLVGRSVRRHGDNGPHKPIARSAVSPIATLHDFPEIPITRMMNRSRAIVKIQDGCNGACSFCVIPQTRGRARSRQPARVIHQVTRLVDNGYREIVLAGVHLGDYGPGNDGPIDGGWGLGSGETALSHLIQRILAIPGLMRLRLSSIGPNAVTDEIIRLMATEARFARHLHIPLQSGSDEILARMNRDYRVARFEGLMHSITDAIPECGIGTDILCGFPGESETLFEETVARITDLPLSYLHPFPYSARPGFPAESFHGQVSNEEKKSRTRRLKQLSREKTRAFQQRHLGRRVSVLLEGPERDSGKGPYEKKDSTQVGWTDNYLRVSVRGVPANSGAGLQTVRVTGLGEDGLTGEIFIPSTDR